MPIQPPNPAMPNQNNRGLYAPRLPMPSIRSSFEPPPTLPGYFVDVEDDIIVKDIPMDDSISYFPTRDLQKIFIRQWNKRGNLECLTYVLEPEPKPLPAPDPPPPMQQEPSKEMTMIADTLTSLNNGLAATFGQFGTVLQSMQQKMDGIEQQIANIPRFTVDDGGQG